MDPAQMPDQAAMAAYFEALMAAWLRAHPDPGSKGRQPGVEELLDFAEANPEVAMLAMAAASAGTQSAPPDTSAPGASLAAAARAAAPRAAAPPPPPPSEEMLPEPGFVVKTRDESGRKVFINICSSPLVAAPGDWANGQVPLAVKEALEREAESGSGGSALRLPLACGAPRAAPDAEGSPSSVCDVVFASGVVAAAAKDVRLKAFLIGTALSHAGAKHGWRLDERYKLPRRAYFDEPVRSQRIRADGAGGAGARITELPSDEPPACAQTAAAAEEAPSFALRVAPPPAPASKAAAKAGTAAAAVSLSASSPASAAAAPPAADAFTLSFEGRPCAAVLARVALPPAAAAAARAHTGDAAGSGALRLSLRRHQLLLELDGARVAAAALPFELDAARAMAWLEAAAGTTGASAAATPPEVSLLVRLPLRAYRDVAREAAAAAPPQPSPGALDLSAAAYLELID